MPLMDLARPNLRTSTLKAQQLCHKIALLSLTSRAKWVAYCSIIEPAVCYPSVNSYFSPKDITKLNSVMSSFQCSSLALNRHFPRAILYGLALLGGIGLPSPSARATKERINYFLYNIRRPPFIQQSFEVSLIFMQLEIVSFQQFFSQSYLWYGHLATKSMGVQIWSETEPYGLTL